TFDLALKVAAAEIDDRVLLNLLELVQQNANADRRGNQHRDNEDADPEGLGSDVLQVLALCDEVGLGSHQDFPPAAASSASRCCTVRTNTSCSDGSLRSKLRIVKRSASQRSAFCGSSPDSRKISAALLLSLRRSSPGSCLSTLPSPS